MFITEIKGKKLKKPLEVKVNKYYLAEIDNPSFYGEGDTEEEAIEYFKELMNDVYEDFKDDNNAIDNFKQIIDLFE
jgi:predicted RNase H-like HicB family nuclease